MHIVRIYMVLFIFVIGGCGSVHTAHSSEKRRNFANAESIHAECKPSAQREYSTACRSFFEGFLYGLLMGQVHTLSVAKSADQEQLGRDSTAIICVTKKNPQIDEVIDYFVKWYGQQANAAQMQSVFAADAALRSQFNCK